jgi:predicted metal-dependent hydrolase
MISENSETVRLPRGAAKVEWRRSKRAQRVSLRIDPRGGSVVITLPPRAARAAGMALLVDHAEWVTERLAALPGATEMIDGAFVPVDGIPLRIRQVARLAGGARLEGGEIRVAGDPATQARRVGELLRAEALKRMSRLVAAKCGAAGLAAQRVTVKDTRSRWGSCSADGALMFSWRLVMAPPSVQDYVAAHEVAHLRHMHHGPAFWALVQSLTRHAVSADAWLRTEGPALLRIG